MFTHKHGLTESIIYPLKICEQVGKGVERFNVSTYQCCVLFNNVGSFNRKSDFQKPENLNEPIAKCEKINIAELSLLKEFCGNNFAHVIWRAEADNLPTDTRQLLEDYGLVGCHSARGNDLSVHSRIDSTSYVRLLWESNGEANEFSHAAIFEVNFGKKSESAIADLREQTADTLFSDLGTVALVIEGSDLSITEDIFCAYGKMHSGRQEEASGDQIKSSETTML